MASLLKEYRSFCEGELELHEGRELTLEDYIFRRHGENLPMTPSTFTWRFKLILKKHNLPLDLNVHSSAAHGSQFDDSPAGRMWPRFPGCWGTHKFLPRWTFILMLLMRRSGRSAPRCRGGWGCEACQKGTRCARPSSESCVPVLASPQSLRPQQRFTEPPPQWVPARGSPQSPPPC